MLKFLINLRIIQNTWDNLDSNNNKKLLYVFKNFFTKNI